MTRLFTALLLIGISVCFAQKKPTALKITYTRESNGKPVEGQDRIVVFADALQTVITSEAILANNAPLPFEQTFVDRKSGKLFQRAQTQNGRMVLTADSTSIALQTFEVKTDTRMILGYQCKLAKTIINSNTIEVWYTDQAGIKAAPSALGQNLGLVLETTRNGNFTVRAEKIEKLKIIPDAVKLPSALPATTDLLTYRDILWKSRFTTLPVFKNEVINFSGESKSNDSILRFANGTIIVRKVRMPEIKKGCQVFVDLTEQSNGDAYDRTGSVFIIPTDRQQSFFDGLNKTAKELPEYDNGNGKSYQGVVQTMSYLPLLELMRFFTPFGIKQYNTIKLKNKVWQDSVFYRQDISEFAASMSGKELWIGANIGNYDKGGHKISLNLTIHPEEQARLPEYVVLPLFNTNNVMEMAGQEYATMFSSEKGLEVTFTLDRELKNAKLRYITTGHGGWENGDEFVMKKNSIFLDGAEAFSFVPWRMDCGSYRTYNPASGNFNNGLSSSDYSRSNWCPGTVTNPIFIDLGNLSKGTHRIQVKIPQGASEGGSFSSWNVSGVLLGE